MVTNITKNVTLRVNTETYSYYKKMCKKQGILPSRQFELMMEKQIKKKNNKPLVSFYVKEKNKKKKRVTFLARR